jgi:hypothetical protein
MFGCRVAAWRPARISSSSLMKFRPDAKGVTNHSPGSRSAPWDKEFIERAATRRGFRMARTTPSGLSQFRAIHRTQGGAALALGYVRLPRCGIHSRALRPDSPTHCSLDAPTHCGPDATHCDPDAPTYCDPDAPTYCDPTPTASPIKAQGRAAHPGRTRARPMDRDPDRVAEKWRWVWSSVRPACNPPPATISKNLFSA